MAAEPVDLSTWEKGAEGETEAELGMYTLPQFA